MAVYTSNRTFNNKLFKTTIKDLSNSRDIVGRRGLIIPSSDLDIPYNLNDLPHNDKILYLSVLLRYWPNKFQYLYENSKVTYEDIIELCNSSPELFLCLPISYYEESKDKEAFKNGFIDYCKKHPEIIKNLTEAYFKKIPELRELIIDLKNNGYDILYDILPSDLRKDPEIKKVFNRNKKIYNKEGNDTSGYNQEWKSDGEVEQFFSLMGGYKVLSQAEYLKIVKKYISAQTSISKFCQKYGIKPISGFAMLLSRIDEENLDLKLSEDVAITKQLARKCFFDYLSKVKRLIATDEITIEEYFSEYYSKKHTMRLFLSLGDASDNRKILSKFIDYISISDVNMQIKKLETLYEVSNVKSLENEFEKTVKSEGYQSKNYDLFKSANECKKIIGRFENSYSKEKTYRTIITPSQSYIIDDQIIEKALSYINANGLYLCQYVMNKVTADIAKGIINVNDIKIDNDQKTTIDTKLLEQLSKVNSIDEYFSIIDSESILSNESIHHYFEPENIEEYKPNVKEKSNHQMGYTIVGLLGFMSGIVSMGIIILGTLLR